MLGFFFIVVICCFFLYMHTIQRRNNDVNDVHIPQPSGYPIIGNINLFLGKSPPYIELQRIAEKYGNIFKLSFGLKDVVVLNSPELIRDAFGRKGEDFSGRPYVYSLDRLSRGESGIAFRDFSQSWFQHKKVSATALRSKFVNFFDDSTNSAVFKELNELLNAFKAKRNAFDPSSILGVVITNIIMNITCGIGYKDGDTELQELIQANNNLKVVIKPGDIVDVFPFLKIFPNKRQRLIDHLINVREKVFLREYNRHNDTYNPDNTRDFVDALLSLKMGEDQVVMTAWEIFASGFESTFQTMRWAILYLITNPEVQIKIQTELDESSQQHPTWKDRRHLRYLEATVLEVLRKSSFSSLNGPHQTTNETEISGYKVPKGTMVLTNLWWAHHDPSKWTSPSEFNPDRFIDTDGNIRVPSQFLPFSIGRRMCLGEQLSKMMLFTLLGGILQKYSLLPETGKQIPNTEPTEPDMIRVADQFKIQVRPRDM